jgi:Protein HRI1
VIKKLIENKSVPANYIGVWQRELLETATTKDDSSLVLWMQTQRYHIDIRIPANRPQLPRVDKLEDYTNEELLQLATQQGFAGITQVTPSTATSSEICQWHREVDFQPQTDARDIGKMVFTDVNTVIETGVDEAYLEVWRRLGNSQQPCWFKLTTGKNRKGLETPAYLMRAGKFVAYARPRQVALPKSTSLLNAIQTYKPQRQQLLDWLDMEISFGEMLDDQHWKIKHSTLPFKEQLIFAYG